MGCYNLSSFNGNFASPDGRLLIYNNTAIAFAPKGLESYTFPNNITKIGKWLIYNCNELRSLSIPNSVIIVDDYAVYYCSGLENIYIGESVKSIGKEAFWNCPSLRHVTIPKNVTTLGWSVFDACHLEYIRFESATPPDGIGLYSSSNAGFIYVPTGAYNTYCEKFTLFNHKFVTYRDIMNLCKNQPNNEFWYYSPEIITSSISEIDANIEYNSCSDGFGVMKFRNAIKIINKLAFNVASHSISSFTLSTSDLQN